MVKVDIKKATQLILEKIHFKLKIIKKIYKEI